MEKKKVYKKAVCKNCGEPTICIDNYVMLLCLECSKIYLLDFLENLRNEDRERERKEEEVAFAERAKNKKLNWQMIELKGGD